MKVEIDDSEALEMLVKRVQFWTDDQDTLELYARMYENYIDSGCFEGMDFNVMVIVDNDYVNYCDVVCVGDDAYEGIKKLFDKQGLGDISCEDEDNGGYSFIEAEYNGCFLCRW